MPRILVVEDDPQILFVMAELLRGDGFEVDTAENGRVAMAKVRVSSPDLVTLDLMMPVMDGWEFLRQYRMLPVSHDKPVLVVSAAGRPDHEQWGRCEFLAKPFEVLDLFKMVERLVLPG
jgi:twitching motility two-component system response regulator PilH